MDQEQFRANMQNWNEYVEEYTHCAGFLCYLLATDEFVPALESILETATSFEQLKEEIQAVCKERADFTKFAWEHLP